MEKLKISIDKNNIHPIMREALRPLIERKILQNADKIILSTNDVEYIQHLIEKGDLITAKSVLNNLKSVAKIINEQITVTESYLVSLEV